MTSSRLVVTVPSDTAAGTIEVSVVTAAGLESDRHALEVAEDKPVVTAVAPLPIVPGGTHEIRGRFFVPTEFTDKPSVTFDGVPVPVTRYDGKHATVKAPSTLTPGGKTKIAVRAAAALVVSDEVEVPVKPK